MVQAVTDLATAGKPTDAGGPRWLGEFTVVRSAEPKLPVGSTVRLSLTKLTLSYHLGEARKCSQLLGRTRAELDPLGITIGVGTRPRVTLTSASVDLQQVMTDLEARIRVGQAALRARHASANARRRLADRALTELGHALSHDAILDADHFLCGRCGRRTEVNAAYEAIVEAMPKALWPVWKGAARNDLLIGLGSWSNPA